MQNHSFIQIILEVKVYFLSRMHPFLLQKTNAEGHAVA
jgi:hypothetical protein